MKPHVYRVFDDRDVLLYVGFSKNVVRRLHEHERRAPWFAEVASIRLEPYPTAELALQAETSAIHRERPKYNVVHNSQSARHRRFVSTLPLSDGADLADWMARAEVPCACGARPGEWCVAVCNNTLQEVSGVHLSRRVRLVLHEGPEPQPEPILSSSGPNPWVRPCTTCGNEFIDLTCGRSQGECRDCWTSTDPEIAWWAR